MDAEKLNANIKQHEFGSELRDLKDQGNLNKFIKLARLTDKSTASSPQRRLKVKQ
jgi:hypothetical protein